MEPARKFRLVAAGDAVECRDSTYIHNLEQLVMEQAKVIQELKKDVSQINSSIEEIRQMLAGPTVQGELDTETYNSFPIANKTDLERVDEMLQDPAMRTNITAYVRKLKAPGDTDFNLPLQHVFTDEFLSNYNAKGSHGREDVASLLMYQVLQDAWTNEYVSVKEFLKCIAKGLHSGRNRYSKRTKSQANFAENC